MQVFIMASGAGGRYPRELRGRSWSCSRLQPSISTLASSSVSNASRFNSSSLRFPLKDSVQPFSQGLPGSMNRAFTPSLSNHFLADLAEAKPDRTERGGAHF